MPDRAAVPLKVIWHTVAVAIVIGHVIAVYVAHRVALNVFGAPRAVLCPTSGAAQDGPHRMELRKVADGVFMMENARVAHRKQGF